MATPAQQKQFTQRQHVALHIVWLNVLLERYVVQEEERANLRTLFYRNRQSNATPEQLIQKLEQYIPPHIVTSFMEFMQQFDILHNALLEGFRNDLRQIMPHATTEEINTLAEVVTQQSEEAIITTALHHYTNGDVDLAPEGIIFEAMPVIKQNLNPVMEQQYNMPEQQREQIYGKIQERLNDHTPRLLDVLGKRLGTQQQSLHTELQGISPMMCYDYSKIPQLLFSLSYGQKQQLKDELLEQAQTSPIAQSLLRQS